MAYAFNNDKSKSEIHVLEKTVSAVRSARVKTTYFDLEEYGLEGTPLDYIVLSLVQKVNLGGNDFNTCAYAHSMTSTTDDMMAYPYVSYGNSNTFAVHVYNQTVSEATIDVQLVVMKVK